MQVIICELRAHQNIVERGLKQAGALASAGRGRGDESDDVFLEQALRRRRRHVEPPER